MDFDLTSDQEALRDGIRALLEGRFPMSRVRDGFDRSMFDELVHAGVFSLQQDGFGWADAVLVFEELGRALVPGPVVWSYLCASSIGGIVTGTERRDGGPLFVEHCAEAENVAVLDHDQLVTFPAAVVGGDAIDWPLDPLTPLTRLDRVPDGELHAVDVRELRNGGAVLTAAYLVGIAQACTELSLTYAKERQQFDRPIGSFQSIKHLLADMFVRTEVARVATHAAAVSLDTPALGDPTRAVSGAKVLTGESAIANGRGATQVYGGMGFTWEIDVHLFLKRAWLLDTVFGSIDDHADRVAASLNE